MSEMPPIRLIATDVDGTLLASNGKLPEDNRRAILAAQERGVIVAIASGRFAQNVYLLLQDYGLRCPMIACNGAESTTEDLVPLAEHAIPPAPLEAVYDTITRAGADYFIFAQGCVCTSRSDRMHHSELSHGERIASLGFRYTRGAEAVKAALRLPVRKFYICDNVPLPPLRAALAKIPGIELTQSSDANIEIRAAGVNKGLGVADLAAHYGIPMSQVMTLGDQENDLPMLKAAGWGVAMGNGSEQAKHAARFVTDTNDNCGFARAIERWAL